MRKYLDDDDDDRDKCFPFMHNLNNVQKVKLHT